MACELRWPVSSRIWLPAMPACRHGYTQRCQRCCRALITDCRRAHCASLSACQVVEDGVTGSTAAAEMQMSSRSACTSQRRRCRRQHESTHKVRNQTAGHAQAKSARKQHAQRPNIESHSEKRLTRPLETQGKDMHVPWAKANGPSHETATDASETRVHPNNRGLVQAVCRG
jgi:hypothetical protein